MLYDNVRIEGNDLNLMNRWNSPPKAGWAAINCLLWQCQAANVRCEQPPGGNNWAIGIWATPSGDGQFEHLSEFVKPISLYQQQLNERLGQETAERVFPLLLKPVSATNPTIKEAKAFTARLGSLARQLIDLVRPDGKSDALQSIRFQVLRTRAANNSPKTRATSRLSIVNGWLTANGEVLTGDHFTPRWWQGNLQREAAEAMGPAITRFAPGRHGTGLTDELAEVAKYMTEKNIIGYDHHYGLWYDRRRDDHLMVRRTDGEVVPPFYEQPFARSGKGTAWDGLSRYDLNKFNNWYWKRLREFAELGEQKHHPLCYFIKTTSNTTFSKQVLIGPIRHGDPQITSTEQDFPNRLLYIPHSAVPREVILHFCGGPRGGIAASTA